MGATQCVLLAVSRLERWGRSRLDGGRVFGLGVKEVARQAPSQPRIYRVYMPRIESKPAEGSPWSLYGDGALGDRKVEVLCRRSLELCGSDVTEV